MKMKVAVVVPNWNGADLVATCLRSLQAQTYSADIIVVDNGSVDDSLGILERGFPAAHLIKLPKNTGFAGGVNAGIRYALGHDYDAVALLNNDAVAEKDWLERLVAVIDKPRAGIVTSKIVRSDHTRLDSTGDYYSAWGTAFPRGRDETDSGQYDHPGEVFAASGGASLYRTELFRQIGLFDRDFFAYYEDVDLSFRARLAGWRVMYQPGAVVYHEVGATSGKVHGFAAYHSLKNIFFLSYKNLPLRLLITQFPKRAVYYTALHARVWQQGKITSSLRALMMIVWLLPRKTLERWRIQKHRQISTPELNRLIVRGLPPSAKHKLRRYRGGP